MGRDPIPRRRSFPGAPMRGPRSTRYQPRFPAVVPVRGEGRSRVTHPFATLFAAEAALTVRLACVRHAASVHPEPGSNSSFGRPLEGRLSSNQNKEKAIGMMVGTRDRVPLGIGLSSEISAGILAGGGPARVPIRFPRYPVFKVPGASSAPPRRFLPSAAQGDILRDLSLAVKNFFQKVLSGFEVPSLLLSIMLSERRNPRSPQTRVSHYSYSVLPPQDLFYTSLMNFRLPTCRTQSFSFSGSTLYTLGATASPLSFTPPPSMRRRASPTLCARPAS